MIYGLEQGRTEAVILEQCRRDNLPVPAAIANAPELEFGANLFLNAFVELSSCRSQDGPIPWTAMIDYCTVNELDAELRDELMYIVRSVDSDIMAYRAAKAESKTGPGKKGKRNGK